MVRANKAKTSPFQPDTDFGVFLCINFLVETGLQDLDVFFFFVVLLIEL